MSDDGTGMRFSTAADCCNSLIRARTSESDKSSSTSGVTWSSSVPAGNAASQALQLSIVPVSTGRRFLRLVVASHSFVEAVRLFWTCELPRTRTQLASANYRSLTRSGSGHLSEYGEGLREIVCCRATTMRHSSSLSGRRRLEIIQTSV